MAGRGARLRPHTLTIPKPLIPVAGVPIVEQLVRDIAGVVNQPIEEVAFIIGDPAFFGAEIVEQLLKIASEARIPDFIAVCDPLILETFKVPASHPIKAPPGKYNFGND